MKAHLYTVLATFCTITVGPDLLRYGGIDSYTLATVVLLCAVWVLVLEDTIRG